MYTDLWRRGSIVYFHWTHAMFLSVYIVYFAVVERSINIFIIKATFNTYIEHLDFYICLKISIACAVKHACNSTPHLFSIKLLKWLIIEPTIAVVRCNGSFACFLLLVTLIKYQTRNNKNQKLSFKKKQSLRTFQTW